MSHGFGSGLSVAASADDFRFAWRSERLAGSAARKNDEPRILDVCIGHTAPPAVKKYVPVDPEFRNGLEQKFARRRAAVAELVQLVDARHEISRSSGLALANAQQGPDAVYGTVPSQRQEFVGSSEYATAMAFRRCRKDRAIRRLGTSPNPAR